jgi:hypothetical protein
MMLSKISQTWKHKYDVFSLMQNLDWFMQGHLPIWWEGLTSVIFIFC